MVYYTIYTVIINNFVKQCNVSKSDEQKYILQMSAIDVYVQLKHENSNNSINAIFNYPTSLVFCVLLFLKLR